MNVSLDVFVKSSFTNVEITLIRTNGEKINGLANTIPFLPIYHIPRQTQALYLIREKVTGRFYVGSTRCVYLRKANHVNAAVKGIHPNPNLRNVFEAIALVDFEFQYFAVHGGGPDDIIRDLEQDVLDFYQDTGVYFNYGRNAKAPRSGMPISNEHRQRLSEVHRGKNVSDTTKRKMSEAHRGVKRPIEAILGLMKRNEKLIRKVSINGEIYPTIAEAAKKLNLPPHVVRWRLVSTVQTWVNWRYVD